MTDGQEAPPDGGGGVDDQRNLADVAKFFSVSMPTVRGWIDGGCPVVQRGGNGVPYVLSLRAVAEWRDGRAREEEERRQAQAAADNQLRFELGTDLLSPVPGVSGAVSPAARASLTQAEYTRVKMAKEMGELVLYAEVAEALAVILQTFRQNLLNLPSQIGADFDLSDALVLAIKGRMASALKDLSDAMREVGRQHKA